MTNKKKTRADRHTLKVEENKDESLDEVIAKLAITNSAQSAMTVKRFGVDKTFQDVDLACLADTLSEQIKATNSNDLANLEGMLTGQAFALNAIFNRLTQIASWNIDDHLKGAEILLKLGLRAQSQCRSTIEAISTVKNPPVMGYVRQANITQGPQQVNNGIEPGGTSRAGENQNAQNELLEVKNDNQLDTGTQSQTISNDSAMETLGKVHRG